MAARPITRADFARSMAPLGPFPAAPFFAVGVSGGPDSLALALLLKDWLAERQGRLLALVVDHGLRAESGKESLSVVRQLKALGIEAKRLVWHGKKPTSGIQEAARNARYRLFAQALRKAGALYLALGHHLDDQIETFKLRLASGPEAALGMAAISAHPDFLALRPLLGFGKDRLVATVKRQGLDFVEDPSNLDPRFARGRLRLEGIGAEEKAKLLAFLGSLTKSREASEARLAESLAAQTNAAADGTLLVRTQARAGSADLLRPALREALRALGESNQAPAPRAVARLLDEMRGRDAGTLAGCRIIRRREGLLLVREETHSYPAPWRPLTQKGWNFLVGRVENPGLPGPVLFALPSLWRGGRPIAIPYLGVGREKAPIWRPWPPLGGLGVKAGAGRLGALPDFS